MKKQNITGNTYRLEATSNKSKVDRTIILHSNAIESINEFLELYPNNSKYVFQTKYIRRSFITALKKAGINKFRFHDLRHTFATHLSDINVPLRYIQMYLGHSSVLLTQNYIATDTNKLIDDIEKLCY